MRITRTFAVPVALISLVMIGCSGPASAPPAPTSSAGAVTSYSPTGLPAENPRSLTFELKPGAGSGAHGTVTIDTAAGGYTMTVEILGLNPNSHHLLNMHAGTCAAQDTNVMLPLEQDVKANDAGEVTYVKGFPNLLYVIPSAGRILTVHGDKPGVEIYDHIACADLTD